MTVKKVKKDKFAITGGKLDISGFESLKFKKREDSLCQNIIMLREMRYNRNRENKCEHTIPGTGYENNVLPHILYLVLFREEVLKSRMRSMTRIRRLACTILVGMSTTLSWKGYHKKLF